MFDGYVTSVNFDVGSEPGTSRIEVGGMDTSVLMSLEEKIATWKDMSDSDIVQQIVGGYGVTVQADSTATVHQENRHDHCPARHRHSVCARVGDAQRL